MMPFGTMEVEEAVAHAVAGGQALHLHRIIPDRATAPRCFVQAVDRGEPIAHLFDQDRERLITTARMLGVKVIYIDRANTPNQHIDLCGGPLLRLLARIKKVDSGRLADVMAEFEPEKAQDTLF